MRIIAICLLLFATHIGAAQVYSNKPIKKDTITDRGEYPDLLPILGAKAYELGFDLPYSAGLGINYLTQNSEIVVSGLQVGFNHNGLYDLSQIVRFTETTSESQIVNFRPDVWVLPFLNVYGILATSQTQTNVAFDLYTPGFDGESTFITSYETSANFMGSTMGFGLMPTVGVGHGWFALDMNMTWTDIPELSEPAFSFVFGPRLGRTIEFKKEERNIAGWVGGFRVNIGSETSGDIQLSEVVEIPQEAYDRIDNGYARLEEVDNRLDQWYEGLPPFEQRIKEPVYNRAKEGVVNAGAVLTEAEAALRNIEEGSVQYELNKRQANMWNFIVGAQYQHNKHWMLRAEYGFLGTRSQTLLGLQYRFGL